MVVAWIVFAVLVSVFGRTRTIGWGWALFWSLLLSPLVGFIIVLCYPSKASVQYNEQMLRQIKELTYVVKGGERPQEQEGNPFCGEVISSKVKGRGITYKLLGGNIQYSDGKKGFIKCMPNGKASVLIDEEWRIFEDVHYAADALYDLLPEVHDDDYFVMSQPLPRLSLSDKIKVAIKATFNRQ